MAAQKSSRPLEEAMGSCLHVAVLAVKTKPLRDLHALPPIGLYAFRVAKGLLVPQAITASRGFARREGASQIYVGRVDIEYYSPNWRPYSFHTQYAFQEREPSPHRHTPLICVRIRGLLGLHRRTPRVDIRNTLQLPDNR